MYSCLVSIREIVLLTHFVIISGARLSDTPMPSALAWAVGFMICFAVIMFAILETRNLAHTDEKSPDRFGGGFVDDPVVLVSRIFNVAMGGFVQSSFPAFPLP